MKSGPSIRRASRGYSGTGCAVAEEAPPAPYRSPVLARLKGPRLFSCDGLHAGIRF
ncbi:MAG: hypothetical protein N2050_04505 [Flavobacteriales bacterium]|nr:hypothetical protein [Flavobacteriales bacterium]